MLTETGFYKFDSCILLCKIDEIGRHASKQQKISDKIGSAN